MTTTNCNPKPPSRWFAFRLRTLFVVVAILSIPLAWVAYCRNSIQQRHHFIEHLTGPPWTGIGGSIDPPLSLRLLGESGVRSFGFPTTMDKKSIDRAKRLFPEAEISIGPDDYE